MTGLAEVLRGLAAHDGVQGAWLRSSQGLPSRSPTVLARAGTSHRLAIAPPETDIGPRLHDLGQHGPALAGLR